MSDTTTRHAAYAVRPNGRPARHPFASFPHPEAARRWLVAHPGEAVRFVPPLPPASVAEWAEAQLTDAPPLTPETIARLRRLFTPGV